MSANSDVPLSGGHRRRIETEEKTKVVASVGEGGEIINLIPCHASCFSLDDFE